MVECFVYTKIAIISVMVYNINKTAAYAQQNVVIRLQKIYWFFIYIIEFLHYNNLIKTSTFFDPLCKG